MVKKEFVFDSLVDEDNLLNQKQVIEDLKSYVGDGKRIVLYGLRNRAKTSIIRNIIVPHWQRENPDGLAFYVELMNVKDRRDISERFTKVFNESYGKKARIKSFLEATIRFFKGLRPIYELGPSGEMEFSLKSSGGDAVVDIEELLERIGTLAKAGTACLLCFDEFQDIAPIKEAEAILRKKFEELPLNVPIVVLGSKQHMLSEIFEEPKTPFYKWGIKLILRDIPYEEYYPYLKERFKGQLKNTPIKVLKYLQDRLLRSPEEIHRICYEANKKLSDTVLTEAMVDRLIYQYIKGNSNIFETNLDSLTQAQVNLLKLIAFSSDLHLKNVYSQNTLQKVGVSSAGMRKILKKLLDKGFIDKREDGYYMLDAFLLYHLKATRLPV